MTSKFLLRIFSDLNSVKTRFAPDMDERTFQKVIEFDPTYNPGTNSVGSYGKWLLNIVKKNPNLLQYMTNPGHPTYKKWRDALDIYDKIKRKLPPEMRDINRFDHPSDISAISAANASLLQDVKTKEEIKRSETEVVLENSDWLVIRPLTHRSANLFGHGTNWCVSAESDTGRHEFQANQAKGPILFFLSKTNPNLKFVGGGKASFDFKDRMQQHSPDIKPLLDSGFPVEWVKLIAERYPNYSGVFKIRG